MFSEMERWLLELKHLNFNMIVLKKKIFDLNKIILGMMLF